MFLPLGRNREKDNRRNRDRAEGDRSGNRHPPGVASSRSLPNDGIRLNLIRDLIREGHLSRVLISHDICSKTRLQHYGGHGYVTSLTTSCR